MLWKLRIELLQVLLVFILHIAVTFGLRFALTPDRGL